LQNNSTLLNLLAINQNELCTFAIRLKEHFTQ